jgi:transcriptional regulator GlxA family with amidase domain
VVAALVGTRAAAFELGTVHEVFGIDRSEYADPWYECRLVAAYGSPVPVSDASWTISTPYSLPSLEEADTIAVVTWPDFDLPAKPEVLDAIRAAHARGARIISVCTGAFLLAEAGLLDGKRATTHWRFVDELAKRYPSIDLDCDVLYVDAGDGIYTSAGTGAGVDLCLHLVRLDHGADVANAVARRMVVPPQRDGGQAQFVNMPVPCCADDDPIASTLEWALENLDQPLRVEHLARHSLLSPRTFARRFRSATGTTPMQWLARQRVLHAQRLLETTDLSVDGIAERCGFGTGTVLRAHFRRVTGTSPQSYRRTFRPADAVGV